MKVGDNRKFPSVLPQSPKVDTEKAAHAGLRAHCLATCCPPAAVLSERQAADLQEAAVSTAAGTCGLHYRQHNSVASLNYPQGNLQQEHVTIKQELP